MKSKDKIIQLYNRQIAVLPPDNPFIHLNNRQYSVCLGSIMRDKIFANSSVLDLGCATADILNFLDKHVLESIDYTGMDINSKFLDINVNKWKSYDNIKFMNYDIIDKTIDNTYDIILINDTFAYFETKDIIEMIDYYSSKANVLLSFSLLLYGRLLPEHLLIEQKEYIPIIEYVIRKYPYVTIDKISQPERLRIDITKGDS